MRRRGAKMSEFLRGTALESHPRRDRRRRRSGIAADLGVADALAGGPRSVAELAAEVGADADTLHRILRALASDGVFAEDEPRRLPQHRSFGAALRDAPALARVRASLRRGLAARRCADARRDRRAAFARAFGTRLLVLARRTPGGAHDLRPRDGGRQRSSAPTGSPPSSGARTRQSSTSAAATGALLRALARAPAGAAGIVFDLPETVRTRPALGDRIEFVAGELLRAASRPATPTSCRRSSTTGTTSVRRPSCATFARAAPDEARLLVLDSCPAGNEPAA